MQLTVVIPTSVRGKAMPLQLRIVSDTQNLTHIPLGYEPNHWIILSKSALLRGTLIVVIV